MCGRMGPRPPPHTHGVSLIGQWCFLRRLLSPKQSLLLLELISEQMAFREGNKEEGALWRGSGEAAPAELREVRGWGGEEKGQWEESRATSKGSDFESPRANISEDRFGLRLHPGWICVTGHLRNLLQLIRVISPSAQFLILRKH